MSRNAPRNMSRGNRRKPLTREELLPLRGAYVRALSLEHHLALAALRDERGSGSQLAVLIKVTYLVYFISRATREPVDIELLHAAEALLDRCLSRGQSEGTWVLSEDDNAVVAQVLALHDWQLESLPAFRYGEACARVTGLARLGEDPTQYSPTTSPA